MNNNRTMTKRDAGDACMRFLDEHPGALVIAVVTSQGRVCIAGEAWLAEQLAEHIAEWDVPDC